MFRNERLKQTKTLLKAWCGDLLSSRYFLLSQLFSSCEYLFLTLRKASGNYFITTVPPNAVIASSAAFEKALASTSNFDFNSPFAKILTLSFLLIKPCC